MANKPRNSKQAQSGETSKSIAEQTEAYLKSGGKIEQIQRGVSSQNTQYGKQIRISSK